MKFHSPMIIVSDISKSKEFYTEVLQQQVSQDLDNYLVFSGGFSMMSREQWTTLTGQKGQPKGTAAQMFELYFEEDDIEYFVQRLEQHGGVKVFTQLEEAPWAQKALRFLDPDQNVIEVAESMECVVKKLLVSGLSIEDTSKKSMMPVEFVQKCWHEI